MKRALYAFAVAGMISGVALAGGPDMHVPMTEFKPFVGVNYSYLNVDAASVTNNPFGGDADSFNGLGFEAGLKYGQYLGYAVGWDHYFNQTNNASALIRPENFYFDVRGYYPIMSQFDLIGSVGADYMSVASTVSNTFGATGATATTAGVASSEQLNLRLGVGADYYFTPNWGVQGMFNWVPSHGQLPAGYSNFWTINAGVYYMFS